MKVKRLAQESLSGMFCICLQPMLFFPNTAAKTTPSTTLASTHKRIDNDKASTMSSSAETTQEMSSTRGSRFSSREGTHPITTIGTEDISKTRGEGFSDTLDDESESAANTSLIAALSASLVVICVMVAVALFCFHKKR